MTNSTTEEVIATIPAGDATDVDRAVKAYLREKYQKPGNVFVGVVHRLIRSDRPVRLELTPLCTWRSAAM